MNTNVRCRGPCSGFTTGLSTKFVVFTFWIIQFFCNLWNSDPFSFPAQQRYFVQRRVFTQLQLLTTSIIDFPNFLQFITILDLSSESLQTFLCYLAEFGIQRCQ